MTTEDLRRQDDTTWADHYTEPHTGALYRQDERGNWYDLEGARLAIPLLLRGEVLISLPRKTSRRSYAFRDQPLLVSPNLQILQVGRLVLDANLNPVRYFGDRLAGLGPGHVDFGEQDVWQEVLLGLTRRAFINEYSYEPLLLNNEEIVRYAGRWQQDGLRFERFASATRGYLLGKGSDDLFRVGQLPADVDLDTYVRLGDHRLARARVGGKQFFIDLHTRQPHYLPELPETPLLLIERKPFLDQLLFNIRTAEDEFVYDAGSGGMFQLNGGKLRPQRLRTMPGFGNHLYLATIGGVDKVCDRKTRRVVRLEPGGREIGAITGQPGDRLLAAVDTEGYPLLLDAGAGLDDLKLARAGGEEIVATLGRPLRLGGLLIQPAEIRRLGSTVPRMVVISEPELAVFTLPSDLPAYADQPGPSAFAGCEVISVDMDQLIKVGDLELLPARFLSYSEAEETVLLRAANGRPLQLDGAGHRNELVTGLVETTLTQEHRLGDHRMIGAHTLTEDHKPGELLFSLATERSWLPFYDGFLPIFRRVLRPSVGEESWEYVLYELREASGVGEYVAVEKAAPFRILALRSARRLTPKIINQKKRALISPEDRSQWRKLFTDSGTLVEVI